jgi:hypothetical protein
MHMLRLDIHLNDLDSFLLGKRADVVAYLMANISSQYATAMLE